MKSDTFVSIYRCQFNRPGTINIFCLLILFLNISALCFSKSIEEYATIEAYAGKDKIPVYAFGYTYIYGIGPDMLPGVVMQQDNSNPIEKFHPKKSWEIEYNYCGSTPAREPKTMWNDDQPLLPVHLIDEDVYTSWSSRGMSAHGAQKEWIRIDLAAEYKIKEIVLVGCPAGPGMNVGTAFPANLTVKASTNGKDWTIVYQNPQFPVEKKERNIIHFNSIPAKMIWVIGDEFERVGNWGPAFSIAEMEVTDEHGDNVAAVSRGAGVQVSSTYYGYGMDRFTQDMLWPVQYDLGFKWTRVGYDIGLYLWSYVERQKGKLQIDAKADAAVTEACNNGVKVILCLDKGNWLYHDPPRKTDWKKSRVYELMETYYDHQGWPHESNELMEGYLNYVRYMVNHFKGRVEFYEICNEWQGIGIENYCRILNSTIKAIQETDPAAGIMLGSTGGFDCQAILQCLGVGAPSGIRGKKLELHGMHVVKPKNLQFGEGVVEVDAKSNAEAGIVLRYQNDNNYVLAIYSPPHRAIYFHERVDGNWGGMLKPVYYGDLGTEIHLKAILQGNNAAFSVSDAQSEYVSSHKIQTPQRGHAIGLFHNLVPEQQFDNFIVKDLSGQVLFEDNFDTPDGTPARWDMGTSLFVNTEKIGPQINAVGWHPWYQADPDSHAYRHYAKDVKRFKEFCKAAGFDGTYIASEWTWMAPYPKPDTDELPANAWCTEIQKAKYSACLMTAHSGMGVVSLFNETFQSGRVERDCNLFRNTSFQVDPITPTQPQPVYYVLRNISTVLDGYKPFEIEAKFSTDKELDVYTFKNADGNLMLAAWIPGKTQDGVVETVSDITVSGIPAKEAVVYDIFNGTKQNLIMGDLGSETAVKNILIKDYPVLIELVQ